MSEKYIDLTEEIWRADEGRTSFGSVNMVLDYLDRRPERVPGRTITESEFHEVADAHRNGGLGWEDLADSLGITVVPDPEPTNAQSLSKLLEEFAQLNASCGGEQGDHDLAEFLDARGVRAGSDD